MGTTPQVQTQEVIQRLREVVGKYKGKVGYLEEVLESIERDITETLTAVGVVLEDTIIGRSYPEKRSDHIYTCLWYWIEGICPGIAVEIAVSLRFAVITYDRENIYNSPVELEDYVVELGRCYTVLYLARLGCR